MATLADIIKSMGDIFKFFITLFSDLFKTITDTPIMWVPMAVTLLFVLVRQVPRLVYRLRRV